MCSDRTILINYDEPFNRQIIQQTDMRVNREVALPFKYWHNNAGVYKVPYSPQGE